MLNKDCFFLTLRMFLPCHEREDGFSVVVGLLFTGCARVLAIVSQLIHPAQVTDGVTKEEGRWRVKCCVLLLVGAFSFN